MEIWGILFRNDRGKNIQTLIDLNITEIERLQIIRTIEVEDYSEGPIIDTLHHGTDMWVFGKDVKDRERSILCITRLRREQNDKSIYRRTVHAEK